MEFESWLLKKIENSSALINLLMKTVSLLLESFDFPFLGSIAFEEQTWE